MKRELGTFVNTGSSFGKKMNKNKSSWIDSSIKYVQSL